MIGRRRCLFCDVPEPDHGLGCEYAALKSVQCRPPMTELS